MILLVFFVHFFLSPFAQLWYKMASRYLKSLSRGLTFFVATLLFWTVFPLVYILVSPLYVYRLLVKGLGKIFHPEWVGMMSCRDVFVSEKMSKNGQNEGGLTSVVSLVFILKGVPDLPKIREHFMNKVLLQKNKRGILHYTKFKYYYEYWLGFPFWIEEKNFSLDSHIRLLEETKERKEVTEDEFVQIMGPLSTKQFSPQMSPWEMLIVENYVEGSTTVGNEGNYNFSNNNDGSNLNNNIIQANNNNNLIRDDGNKEGAERRFALVFRWHHTLCDGFSVVKLVVENFGGLQKEKITKAPRSKQRPSFFQIFKVLADAVINVGFAHLKILILDMDFNRWHLSLSKLTGKWHTVMTEKLPFDLARQASKDLGVATTTILFGSIAGGIRRYLTQHAGVSERKLPKLMRGLFPLPVPGHPLDGLINHWTFANIPMPIHCSNSALRLQKMNTEFDRLKRSAIPGLVWFFSPLYMSVPDWLVNLWGSNRMTTLTLSNFPGPREEIVFFENWEILDTMYFLPRLRGNASMHLAILTYNGKIRVTLTVDKAVMPLRGEAQKLVQCIQEEMFSFQNLEQHHEKIHIPAAL